MPELRKDPLVGRWVIFSPERKQRPVDFKKPALSSESEHDAFSWGHEHLTPDEVFAIRPPETDSNTPGWKVRVVPNRFPALRIEGDLKAEAHGLYDRMNGIGAHEVIIETPDSRLPLEEQSIEAIAAVLASFRSRIFDLSQDTRFRSIQIFKNSGPQAGASLRHPHSQLIALPIVPQTLRAKLDAASAYYREKERNLFEDILQQEQREGTRMVYENNGFSAFCPYASRFPFELCMMPRRHNPHFHLTTDHELTLAADVLRAILRRLSKGLAQPDYNLILHTAPLPNSNPNRNTGHQTDPNLDHDFRWHIEILPRLTGIAGFEFGTGFFINTTLPEEAAQFLKTVRIKP